MSMKDIVDLDGNFLDHRTLMLKYNVQMDVRAYNTLTTAIPPEWINLLNNVSTTQKNKDNLIDIICKCSKACKTSYDFIIKKQASCPIEKHNSWLNYLQIDDLPWNTIYKTCFGTFDEVKLKQFQYFFVQRIIPLNIFLFKCKLKDTELCSFCNSERETIEHFFWTCPLSNCIWSFL